MCAFIDSRLSLRFDRDKETPSEGDEKISKVKDEVQKAMEFSMFSGEIGKLLKPLGVNAGTLFFEMMKMFYRRSLIEISQISKEKTKSYTEFAPAVNSILNELFKEVFLTFLIGEKINITLHKDQLLVIRTRMKSFIKNQI